MIQTSPPSNSRVLVIDDHRKIREPLAVYLRKHGFDVRTAESAEGMWRLLDSQHFDVLVLDVMLHDGDGFELCSQLYREHRLPVILLTARDTAADRIRGLDLGADDYLTKPFEPRELVARINSVLRRRGPQPMAPQALDGPPVPQLRHYRFADLQFASGTGTLAAGAGVSIRLGHDGESPAAGVSRTAQSGAGSRPLDRADGESRSRRVRPHHRPPGQPPAPQVDRHRRAG